ncbi:MAG TPA: quinone-dependent dihydroorotate dehydrogenase [Candidatus Binatus sp.]|uniref:quinone-dependent dihydroorotate dehydrogenase n=1 Tax=Candidatus Binatus sp. TaxID=2811406 RepID=UPI002B45A4D7|nr:quinone-dependent dihydroorotate dehydrogenase [Candidatus Binatus sp.]HKN14358.1 quinone-dependent dihydroorotate dehydrogenase [Candidatus Binatus sp.]
MPAVSAIDAAYRQFLKPFLFSLDAEYAHRLTIRMLSLMPPFPPPRERPELAIKLWGIDFPNPIGLAAGMDKDAVAIRGWETLGFGFAELGTITPRAQAGNETPRLWRIPERRALINRLGFPSEGMAAVAPRIERMRKAGISIRLGLNFGPNSDTPPEGVAADYTALMERLGPLADFIVINVSSPNTPGLRNWQSPEKMSELFAAMREKAGEPRPVLVKIAPDLERNELFRICETALELGVDGIVACNTSVAREALGVSSPHPGGLSGRPILIRARELIRDIHTHTRGKIPIIGVGGVSTAEDAWLHIRAGAALVELYTALIYEGPGVAERIKAGLADLLRRNGFRSISEVVGIDR